MTILKHPTFGLNNAFNELFHDSVLNSSSNYAPPVNIYENESGVILEMSIAGIKKEAIELQFEKGLLTIQFQSKKLLEPAALGKQIKNEFTIKPFKRSFSIDQKINSEAIEAKLEDGILLLTLPYNEAATHPKKVIPIN